MSALRCLLSVLIVSWTTMAMAAPENTEPNIQQSFEGRVVLFEVDLSTTLESRSDSIVLRSPSVITLGKRSFVFGESYTPTWAKEGDATPSGSRAVACDRIISFHLFEPKDFDAYSRAIWAD